jgi:hypothetical protein
MFPPCRGANVTQAIEEKAERIYQNPACRFTAYRKNQICLNIADDFKVIFNAAWAKFPGVKAMSYEQAQN